MRKKKKLISLSSTLRCQETRKYELEIPQLMSAFLAFELGRLLGCQRIHLSPPYLFSYSFWETHLGSCELASASLRLHQSVVLCAVSDLKTLQSKCKKTVREQADCEMSCQCVLL